MKKVQYIIKCKAKDLLKEIKKVYENQPESK
jgi:hypothetical protein